MRGRPAAETRTALRSRKYRPERQDDGRGRRCLRGAAPGETGSPSHAAGETPVKCLPRRTYDQAIARGLTAAALRGKRCPHDIESQELPETALHRKRRGRQHLVAGQHRLLTDFPAARPARSSIAPRIRSDMDRRVLGAFLEHLAGPSTRASTIRSRRWRTRTASARTCWLRSRDWAFRSCGTPAAISSPDTTGWTASAQRTSGRRCWIGHGIRSRPTSSAPTSSSNGASWWAPSRCSAAISAPARAEQVAAYVEYCNVDRGTKWSDLRRSHGYEQPHNVRYWCLGNEMDGPWQMGHMTAREYGRKARDAARQFRVHGPEAEADRLRLQRPRACRPTWCGTGRCWRSATTRWMPSRCTATTATRPNRPATTCRAIPGDEPRHGTPDPRDRRGVRLRAGSARNRRKRLWLSFDEWNVWYRARSGDAVDGQRKSAPHLLEEQYNLEDALLVGGFSTRCCAGRTACGWHASRRSST